MPYSCEYSADALSRLRHHYRRVLVQVDLACRHADEPLSEEHIWRLIARTASPAWAAAYSVLQAAQLGINRLNRDDNRPLGAIGRALAADETEAAETALAAAQSRFTAIDERLRAMQGLQILLDDIKARYSTYERSQGISEAIFALTLDAEQAAPQMATARPKNRFLKRIFKRA